MPDSFMTRRSRKPDNKMKKEDKRVKNGARSGKVAPTFLGVSAALIVASYALVFASPSLVRLVKSSSQTADVPTLYSIPNSGQDQNTVVPNATSPQYAVPGSNSIQNNVSNQATSPPAPQTQPATNPTTNTVVLPASNPTAPAAQSTNTTYSEPTLNINDSAFRLLICDGPKIPDALSAQLIPSNATDFRAKYGHAPPYIPCDFQGAMMQVQHLINIAIILGVLVAILGFTYAGYLYITGKPGNISKAHEVFPKIFWGFIIMLAAWFVVYQILAWATGSNAFSVLLGKPQ